MEKLIGLIGKRRSGKDTAADALLPFGYKRLKFADALKAMINALLWEAGCSVADREAMIEGTLKDSPTKFLCNQTPRWAMQTLGTEWGRKLIDPDIWVKLTLMKAKARAKVVITDVRFPNEAWAVRDAGGTLIRIVRPSMNFRSDDHSSETEIENCHPHFTVINNGTIEELQTQILTIARN